MAIQSVDGREREYDDYYDPYQPPPVPTGPTPAPVLTPPTTPTTNTQNPPPGTRRPSRPGFYEEWDGTRWIEYSDGVGDPNAGDPGRGDPGGGDSDGGPDPYAGSGGMGYAAPQIEFDPYQSAGPFQPRRDTFTYTPFAYDPYTASSWEDAEKEPGYDASRKQLKNQIEGGAAYRGMLRSGMTLRDIYTGLDSLGQQNFANFDNRRFRNYSANRDGAFQAWSGNLAAEAQKFGLELGVDRDIYDRGATDIDRRNNYNFNTRSAQAADALARWQEQVRSLTQISTAGMNS